MTQYALIMGLADDDDEDDDRMFGVNITLDHGPSEDPDAEHAPCPICGREVEYFPSEKYGLTVVTWCDSCPWMGSGDDLLAGDQWGVFAEHPVTKQRRDATQ